jgi:hypothetical protein
MRDIGVGVHTGDMRDASAMLMSRAGFGTSGGGLHVSSVCDSGRTSVAVGGARGVCDGEVLRLVGGGDETFASGIRDAGA